MSEPSLHLGDPPFDRRGDRLGIGVGPDGADGKAVGRTGDRTTADRDGIDAGSDGAIADGKMSKINMAKYTWNEVSKGYLEVFTKAIAAS